MGFCSKKASYAKHRDTDIQEHNNVGHKDILLANIHVINLLSEITEL